MNFNFSLHFPVDPAVYKETAESQREDVRAIADKLERGEPLEATPGGSGAVAAAILRQWADSLSDKPPRKPGQLPSICRSEVAIHFEVLVRRGMSANKAKETLAGRYEVSPESIRKAVKERGQDAKGFLNFLQQVSTSGSNQKNK
jgi:hypothetical protein